MLFLAITWLVFEPMCNLISFTNRILMFEGYYIIINSFLLFKSNFDRLTLTVPISICLLNMELSVMTIHRFDWAFSNLMVCCLKVRSCSLVCFGLCIRNFVIIELIKIFLSSIINSDFVLSFHDHVWG